MLVRTFTFRVPRKRERRMLSFMRQEARRLLQRIPACQAAYFLRDQKRKREYMWVTVWSSAAACERARQRADWKEVARREEDAGFFGGAPRAAHYAVVLRLGG